jgi:hypothetical protein
MTVWQSRTGNDRRRDGPDFLLAAVVQSDVDRYSVALLSCDGLALRAIKIMFIVELVTTTGTVCESFATHEEARHRIEQFPAGGLVGVPLVFEELADGSQRLVREDGKPLQWHRHCDEAPAASDEPVPLCDETSGLLGEGRWVPLPHPGPQEDGWDDLPVVGVPVESAAVPEHRLTLVVLPGLFAVCRLPADAAAPAWPSGSFYSVTRTADELSVVCRQEDVPASVRCEPGWRCLRVAGKLDFALVGVLAALLVPLAEAGVSVFAVSTFDTDFFLVKEADLDRAVGALRSAGHTV